jgi:leucyl-tRNA synthetase
MELLNFLYEQEKELSPAAMPQICDSLTLMLAPFAPFVAQELWAELDHQGEIFRRPWPRFDPFLARVEFAEIPVQVNGKLRGHIVAPFGASDEQLQRLAHENQKITSFIGGKQIVKVIVVPDRLVNIVVR